MVSPTALVIVLSVIALLLIHQCTRRNKLRVEVNRSGSVYPIVAQMKVLNRTYQSTPWLIGGCLQTVYGMRYRKRSSLKCTRTELDLFDGGNLALDFFIPPDSDDSPFVIIVPTLGGSTSEPCVNNLAETFHRRGWRSAVMNGRGFAGMKFKTERIGCAIDFEDVRDTVQFIRANYRTPALFVVGFSLGSMQALSYAWQDGSGVAGVAVVSHNYNVLGGSKGLERGLQKYLFTPRIVAGLKHVIDKYQFASEETKAKLKKVTTMREFDHVFTAPSRGLAGHEEYYRAAEIYDKIPKVKVPVLVFGADNDPFGSEKFGPIREARESDKVVFVHVRDGGHVAFPLGWNAKKSLIDIVIPDWFEAIVAAEANKTD